MSEDGSNQISNRIDQKLAGLSKTKSNNQFIFRIHQTLRRENEVAYEPEMLSIGPYHHGKSNLLKMEKYKLNYLKELLKRRGESSVERYVAALGDVEEEARNYYGEQISLNRDDFVEMMLLDGCFIIELLRKWDNPKVDQTNGGSIFLLLAESWIKDILLFENQIPFFVLVKLFDMTKTPDRQEKDLIHLAIAHLYPLIAADQPTESSYNVGPKEEIIHLLSLLYKSWCSSMDTNEVNRSNSSDPKRSDFSLITFCQQFIGVRSKGVHDVEDPLLIEGIKSVSELEGDGIEFKKANPKTWLDIKFENGVIEIPPLLVENSTESLLRNLITYEQYMFDLGYSRWNFVTSYAIFMDSLINSPEDVKTLRQRQIIRCWLGNDENIAVMFNKICKNVMFISASFSYKNVFKDLNEYCSKKRNTWRAHLMKNYFSNPWSIISFLAATLLLLLTIAQTVFSVLQTLK